MTDHSDRRGILRAVASGALSVEDGAKLLRGGAGGTARPADLPKSGTTGEPARERLRDWLRTVVAAEAQVDILADRLDEPWERYGFDSVLALRVVRVLERSLGPLPATLLFEHQSVAALADYLAAERGDALARLFGTDKNAGAKAGVSMPDADMPDTDTPDADTPDADTSDADTSDAIAIVGLSCRFPMANDLDQFWRNLVDGRDCVTEVPPERWDHRAEFDPRPGQPGRTYTRWGGFIDDVDRFDAGFFHISPREAERMDPQERLFLQQVWHAMEDGGLTRDALAGTSVGVYVGVMYSQYQLFAAEERLRGNPLYLSSSYASIANRVSYTLNLRGPSMALDTMCSSSLTAIHLAGEALRRGEIDYAIAGGVNLSLHPAKYLDLSQGRYASTDGRCRSFGADGDGYVPGEGVGVAILRTLADAVASGDRIYAVIRGSALGHGGKTNGYTVPNPAEQTRVITQAMRNAGVDPARISYVEAHGTGTALGDPIEFGALAQALSGRPPSDPCALGSVKSNIGHLEGAAGIAGLIKVVLQMRHRQLVPSLHSDPPNPYLDPTSPLLVQRALAPWPAPAGSGPRVAGLSSFGAGGASAHLIIEEYREPDRPTVGSAGPELLLLSAATQERLRVHAGRLADHIATRLADDSRGSTFDTRWFADLAYTTRCGRQALDERLALFAPDAAAAARELRAFAAGGAPGSIMRGETDQPDRPRPGTDEVSAALAATDYERLARLWVDGAAVPWSELPSAGRRRVALPGYPFARERHWPALSHGPLLVAGARPEPGLGYTDDTDDTGAVTVVDGQDPLVRDHRVANRPLLPGAALLDLVRAAATGAGLDQPLALRDITFAAPLAVPPGERCEVTVDLVAGAGHTAFAVRTGDGEHRTVHVRGTVGPVDPRPANLPDPADRRDFDLLDVSALASACGPARPAEDCYHALEERGLWYGPALRVLDQLHGGGDQAVARLRASAGPGRQPALLDGAFQALIAFEPGGAVGPPRVPFAIDRLDLLAPLGESCWVHLRPRPASVDPAGRPQVFDLDLANVDGRIALRVRGLAIRPVPADRGSTVLLRPRWLPAEPAPVSPGAGSPPRTVFVLDRGGDQDGQLVSALRADDAVNHLVRVQPAERFDPGDGTEVLLNPADPGHWNRLLDRLPGEDDPVHFVYVPDSAFPSDQVLVSENSLEASFYFLLALAQALARRASAGPAGPARLVYLYPDSLAGALPEHAATAAFNRVLAVENPKFAFTTVAVPTGPDGRIRWDAELLARVRAELAIAGQVPAHIRYAGGVRQQRGLVEVTAEVDRGTADRGTADRGAAAGRESRFRHDGVYLVTGGLGGIGRRIARHLAEQWHARLVLAGRSAPDANVEQFLATIRRLGGEAEYVRADVGTAAGAAQAAGRARAAYGRLDGVLHLAGQLRDGLVSGKRRTDAEAVLRPKVWAAYQLDRATRDDELDLFVLFSSASSVLGIAGQSDYGYANAFLNEFARWRAGQVLAGTRSGRTVSIAWPLWQGGGMDVDDAAKARIRKRLGWLPLPPAEGIRVVDLAVTAREDEAELVVFHGDREQIMRTLSPASVDSNPDRPVATAELERALLNHLRGLLADELKLPVERLDPRRRFEHLGIESVMVMNLTTALEPLFGELPTTLFFEFQTLTELTRHLLTAHPDAVERAFGRSGPSDAPPQAAPPPEPAPPQAAPPPEARPPSDSDTRWVASASTPSTGTGTGTPSTGKPAAPGPECPEPIAVIGLAGRYPMAATPDELWANLRAGRDCVTEVPSQRWDHAAYFDPDPDRVGRTYSRWGGFMSDVDRFDPLFFGISPREARQMDPQERLFLETAWHTLEDAGYARGSSSGRRIGVFVGVMYAQYQLYGASSPAQAAGFLPSSLSASVANRVSYALNLNGPSLALDTMCSSSLTALHLACSAIRQQDCTEAIVGGVNAILHPNRYLQLSQGRFASTDGRCRSFGAGGDGYVPGEGVGAVLLKPLSRAKADGDHIYGVILATGVNHGGRSNGYTVPTPVAQAALIAETLAKAGVCPEDIDYIEAHGTGTALGDPIEIAGLARAFASGGRSDRSRPVGSIKSNIGHLESAAGIASVTKVLLQLRHEELVPSLHAETLNPHVELASGPFHIQRTLEPWPVPYRDGLRRPRLAAVSAFGAGGANAHVLLQEHLPEAAAKPDPAPERPQLIMVSARTEEQLREVAAGLAERIDATAPAAAGAEPTAGPVQPAAGYQLRDIAFTLESGREPLAERLAFVAADAPEAADVLRRFATGQIPPKVFVGHASRDESPLAAVFDSGPGEEFIANLRRAGDLERLGQLWTGGVDLPPPPQPGRRVPLPGYPFARDRYWLPEEVVTPAGPTAVTRPATAVEPAPVAEPTTVAGSATAIGSAAAVEPAAAAEPAPVADPDLVRRKIVAAMAAVLEAPTDEFSLDVPHVDFGIDSVLAVEIVDRINLALDVALKPTDFFNHATLRKLVAYVESLRPAAPAPSSAEPPPGVRPADSVPVVGEVTEVREPARRESDVDRPDAAATEVAVIGMSARFPGAPDIDQLWANLVAGRDEVAEIPADRWDVRQFWDPDPRAAGKTYSKWGSVLADAGQFDPDFFGLSPREARLMDPQQRLYLMEAWRALENAGYADRDLDGLTCCSFVGAAMGDYHQLLRDKGVPVEGHTFTGTHPAVLASRICYHLNLRGPSLTVDTSCSSSLMAVHLACEAIREGRTELALAGGVAALFTPQMHILASKAGMLSPTGPCRTFDDAADGFVPGEGVGVVVLKSLPAALRDGDPIRGVIAGSGANQDGRSNGLTAPSAPAQTELELAVYERFGIDPDQIGYVECHGTGTRLGDPIEIEALTAAFRRYTRRTGYCAVGSVKSNLGHTLTAAGVAGLIKTLLCLEHGQLVPSLHVTKPNRYISFDQTPFHVNTALRDWPAPPTGPRLAAVSSFGFSGTNVHAVVREAPVGMPRPPEAQGVARLVPVSARTDVALTRRLVQLRDWLDQSGSRHQWRDIAYTLGVGRSHFEVRAAFIAQSPADLRAQIQDRLASAATAAASPRPAPAPTGGPLDAAVRQYLAGEEVDWAGLYRGEPCRRIPLPTYPFAEEHYWPLAAAEASGAAVPARAAVPALPRPGDSPVVVRHRLRTDEPVVRDHVVDGQPLLPAAGHLSLVLQALRDLLKDAPVTLTRAVWLRPVFVPDERDIEVVLTASASDRFSFEVRSSRADGTPVVHSRGEASYGALVPQPLDLAEIRGRCPDRVTAADHYGRFDRIGVRYGAHFRTVQEIEVGSKDALARMVHRATGTELPAGVLDGAIQSVAALQPDEPGQRPHVPFAIDAVHFVRPIPATSYAHARQTGPGNCTVSIVDATGQPCVVIEGLAYRELKADLPTRLYAPRWRRLDPVPPDTAAKDTGQHVVIIGGEEHGLAELLTRWHARDKVSVLPVAPPAGATPTLPGPRPDRLYFLGGIDTAGDLFPDPLGLTALEHSQDHGVRSLFRLVKELLAADAGSRPLDLVVVTGNAHQLRPGERTRPLVAGLFGFVRSLAKELPKWRVRCLDIDLKELAAGGTAADAVATAVASEPPHPDGEEVALRDGQRWRRVLAEVRADPPATPPFRAGGTYLILGGAGGIGSELALHLARSAAANVVLMGRRPAGELVQQRIQAIESAGGSASYVQVDATDEEALAEAVAAVRERHGAIHGVFHSALVLRDARIADMTVDALEAVLAPKVRGAVVLARALRGEPLDLFVFFSSAQSFSGNAGQANYAAACSFKDALALNLAASGVPVHIVNWGYWGEVGVVAKAGYRRRMESAGVHSISPAEGMLALDTILATGLTQAMPLRAEPRVLGRFGIGSDVIEGWDPLGGREPSTGPDGDRLRRAHDTLDAIGACLALRAMQQLGAFTTAGERRQAERLAAELGVSPAHTRLWTTLLDIVIAAGFVETHGGELRATAAVSDLVNRDLAAEAERLRRAEPAVAAHVDLLTHCLADYSGLLTGRVQATEVMFPNGSMAMVERVYHGDPLSDRLNELVAAAVEGHLDRHRDAVRPVRILEIGAGTGGTARQVLELLAGRNEPVEYVYTDVSLSFLRHGRKVFGKQHPYVNFATLDIEADPAEQGFEKGEFDVVVAANVLHATRDLGQTLAHVSWLTGDNGCLVLSETTAFSTFATLTFGLLDGWWRGADTERRIPGSPLADVPTWQRLLTAAGFGRTAALAPAHCTDGALGQHVLVAERTGAAAPAHETPAHETPAHKMPAHRTPAHRTPAGVRPAFADRSGAADRVAELLAATIASALGRSDADLDPDRPFTDYGVDSIIMVELVNSINQRLGIELRTTALFDCPTLAELTAFVVAEYPEAPGVAQEDGDAGLALLRQLASGELTLDQTYARLELAHE